MIDLRSLVGVASPGLAGETLGNIITRLLPWGYAIAGFVLLAYLVFGGYQILVSQGDPKAVAAGREKISNAVFGFFIIFVSYWTVQIVGRILGIEAITNMFG